MFRDYALKITTTSPRGNEFKVIASKHLVFASVYISNMMFCPCFEYVNTPCVRNFEVIFSKYSKTTLILSWHYIDVIMTTMASQITSLTDVYSTVYSEADQRKHQSSASLAFVWGIHRDRWIPRTKGQLRGKYFHLMTSSWGMALYDCPSASEMAITATGRLILLPINRWW